MISRCSAESPARHFRIIALLSFFSSAAAGSSDGSSIAPTVSSSNSSSRPTPKRRDGLEAGDRQHPRLHRRAPFEPTRLTPHVEKHLAVHVLCRGLIPNETHHEPKHSYVVPRIQHLHGEPIAVRDSSDQHLVWCRLHFGLVTLVASDYCGVHASWAAVSSLGISVR